MKTIPILAAGLLLLAGCATKPRQVQYPTIAITSEPSGARIEIDGDYIGETPLEVRYRRGSLAFTGSPAQFVIRAFPKQEGLYSQSKFYDMQDPTPHRVFFDMRMGPSERSLNLNVKQE
jgi:hypothetical protein